MEELFPFKRITLSVLMIDKLISSTFITTYRYMFDKKNTHNTDFCIAKRKQGNSFACDFLISLVTIEYQKIMSVRL